MLILPPEVRRDILMSMHQLEPPAGASQEEQDWAFQQLRYKIQTRTELLAQYDALPLSKPLNHLEGEQAAGGAGEDALAQYAGVFSDLAESRARLHGCEESGDCAAVCGLREALLPTPRHRTLTPRQLSHRQAP